MNRYPFVDCQGLGGHWSLGTIQTGGFDMVHRASLTGGFGDDLISRNRHLVPGTWEQDEGGSASEWTPVQAAYVAGTPPCSGFSLLNVSAAAARKSGKDAPANSRGVDSAINSCMKELVTYGGLVKGTDGRPGAEIISFESVQGAGKEGRPLMQKLRALLEQQTGQRYTLNHVFMSGSTTGSAQMRHRYYVVFARIPFGVDRPEQRRVATYRDAIGDLTGYDLQWEPQAREKHPQHDSWWLREQGILDSNKVADHQSYTTDNNNITAVKIYLDIFLPMWQPGDSREDVMRRYYAEHGEMPKGAAKWWIPEEDRAKGFSGPRMVDPDRPGYVLTGGGCGDFFHWEEPRYLTVRECARLMGFPDSWSFDIARGVGHASAWIGKCCPVSSGRWISGWVYEALEGEPGAPLEELGDREYIYNNTLDYKRWPRDVSRLSPSVK